MDKTPQTPTESKNADTESASSSTNSPATEERAAEDSNNVGEVTFFSIVLSVIQASFGVQNSKNRKRDFQQGTLLPFVVTAVGFTILFVLGLIFVVQMVIA